MTVYLLLAAWMISLLTTVLAQALLELNARYRGTKPKRTFLQSCLFFLILQGALCPGVMLILSLLIAGVRALFRLF